MQAFLSCYGCLLSACSSHLPHFPIKMVSPTKFSDEREEISEKIDEEKVRTSGFKI